MTSRAMLSFNWHAILARLNRARLILAIAVIAILGTSLWARHAQAPAAVAHSAPAIPVEAAAAKRADVPLYLQGLGTVQAFNTVTVTTRVDGQIQNIDFADGQDVKAGDVLAQIDPRIYQATYDQAVATEEKDQAQLANAKLDLQRYTALTKLDDISQQTYATQRALVAQLEAQIKMDQAAVESTKTNLDYTTIRSPIDGRAGIRQIDLGNNLLTTANTNVVVVTQMQPISVVFSLPEENLSDITKATAAHTLVAIALSRDDKTELDRGSIVVLDNEVNQASGTLKLKATFPNAHERLWPGEFVNINLLVRTEKNVLTVPSSALQRGPNSQYVYVVNQDGIVAVRPLSFERFASGSAVIRNGLLAGEIVVTAGQYRLQPGAHVEIPRAQLVQLRPSRTRRRG
jgi:membrane fusion protein, multidrug efflux system